MSVDRFSVATMNLFNFNLPGKPMYADRDGWSKAEYAKKVDWIGRQLALLRADVVGFQELWHRDALHAALEAAGLADDYTVLAELADGKGISTAAIVRKELLVDGSATWTAGFPEQVRLQSSEDPADPQAPAISVNIKGFSRPVLSFDVQLRDDLAPTVFYVAHLKSKLPTRIDHEAWFEADPATFKPHRTAIGAGISTIRRTAEAVALRAMLTATLKGTSTGAIVLGDLNDGQLSNTLNIVTEQPRYLVGRRPGGADSGLYTAQTLQELRDTRDVYYTHVHEGIRESLDHVLVSEQFYDLSRKRIWFFDGLVVNNDHLNYDDHKGLGTGDHGIVQVSFEYAPVQP